jgi:hypothetical protein
LLGDDARFLGDQFRIAVKRGQHLIEPLYRGFQKCLAPVVGKIFIAVEPVQRRDGADHGALVGRDIVNVHRAVEQIVQSAIGEFNVQRVFVKAGQAFGRGGIGAKRKGTKDDGCENEKFEIRIFPAHFVFTPNPTLLNPAFCAASNAGTRPSSMTFCSG